VAAEDSVPNPVSDRPLTEVSLLSGTKAGAVALAIYFPTPRKTPRPKIIVKSAAIPSLTKGRCNQAIPTNTIMEGNLAEILRRAVNENANQSTVS
jgi:hypothetical protein